MKHLTYLKYIYLIFGAMYALTVLLTCAGSVAVFATGGEGSIAAGVLYIFVAFFLCVLTGLYVLAGVKLGRGEGRILGTILSVLMLFNCPGIFIGAYTLWVCWANEETKKIFAGK